MKKVFIVLSGVYAVLIGAFISLALSASLLLPHKPPANFHMLVIAIVIMAILALGLAAVGVGVIMRKNWARISLNAISAIALVYGAIMTVVFLALPSIMRQRMPKAPDNYQSSMVGGLIFTAIFLIVIPLFFLIFFNNKGVKDLFVKPGQPDSLLPFGIKAMAVMSLLVGICSPMTLAIYASRQMPLFVGVTLPVPAGVAYLLALGALNIYMGIGLLKRNKKAWATVIGFELLTIIVSTYNTIFITQEWIQKATAQVSGAGTEPVMSLSQYKLIGWVSVGLIALVIIYLWSRRGVFSVAK